MTLMLVTGFNYISISVVEFQQVDIDAYHLCPCQSGSKIKFCCGKDVINELNEILKKNGSGQVRAALDQLDRAAAKHGDKDCLLVIKTHILISANDIASAKETNALFRKNSPGHSMGLQHLAVIDLFEDRLDDAINSLQDAMDANKGSDIPVAVSNVFKVVAGALVEDGRVFAGLAHLQFASRLRGDQDPEISEMFIGLLQEWSFFSFLFQTEVLEEAPEGVEWEKLYANADRAIARGQFRRALQYLTKATNDFPANPIMLRAVAVVKTILAHEDAGDAWRDYANWPELNSAFAAEALAFAYVQDDAWAAMDPIMVLRYEFDNADEVSESLIASKIFERVETPPRLPDGSPPPKYGFAILDKPIAKISDSLSIDDIALRIGNAEVYGKQTDRPARMDLWVAGSRVDQAKSLLQEIGVKLGDPVEEIAHENSVAQDVLLMTQALLPQELEPAEADRLQLEHRRRRFLNEMLDLPIDKNHELSIRDAAKQAELQNLVYARLLILVSNSKSRFAPEGVFEEMLEKLELPPLGPIKPGNFAALTSALRSRAVDLTDASLEEVETLENAGFACNDAFMVAKGIREYLQRDDRDKSLDATKLRALSKCVNGLSETLDLVQRAKQAADETGDRREAGLALCHEFEIQLEMRNVERARALVQEISGYSDDEEVKYDFTRILSARGLLDEAKPIDQLAGGGQAPPPAAPKNDSKLILPG